MQFWKSIKRAKVIFSAFVLSVLVTGCYVDEMPAAIRSSRDFMKSEYYQLRADDMHRIEDSYMAGQSKCCKKDMFNDDIESLNHYCDAAFMGHKASQIEIGRFYTHTAGAGFSTEVPYDRTLAHAYYVIAGQGGYEYAVAMAQDLGKKLTEEEHKRSKQLVADFPNIPCKITK